MNGELYQISSITIAARKALKDNAPIDYELGAYEKSVQFTFLDKKKVKSVPKWFKRCKKKGIKDIIMMAPLNVENRNLLGFANASRASIVCYYDERVTYFVPRWDFDVSIKKWNIHYTEHVWEEAPQVRMPYINNTESFVDILEQLETFANTIEFEGFATTFKNAYSVLKGDNTDIDTFNRFKDFPIPQENIRLLVAASISDVFGAMGSWNDSPPYYAQEKGLKDEYESLSNELLFNNRMAILYAVNEW